MASRIRQDSDAMGELFIWTDIDPAFEEDFNQWYDREHMAERAGITGFNWARRYKATSGSPHYLALYRAQSLNVFHSKEYKAAFQNQTPWSLSNFARFRNTNRRVMVVTPILGAGTGSALGLVRLGDLETAVRVFDLAEQTQSIDGVLALRILTPNPELSTPLPSENPEGRILEPVLVIDATTEPAASAAARLIADQLGLPAEYTNTFEFLWDLQSNDLRALSR